MSLEDFRKYCKNNMALDYQGRSPEHSKLLRSIAAAPYNFASRIGIVKESYQAIQINREDTPLSTIDVVFFTNKEEAVLCAVLTPNEVNQIAHSQLAQQYSFLKGRFNLAPKRLVLKKRHDGKIIQELIEPNIRDVIDLARSNSHQQPSSMNSGFYSPSHQ